MSNISGATIQIGETTITVDGKGAVDIKQPKVKKPAEKKKKKKKDIKPAKTIDKPAKAKMDKPKKAKAKKE